MRALVGDFARMLAPVSKVDVLKVELADSKHGADFLAFRCRQTRVAEGLVNRCATNVSVLVAVLASGCGSTPGTRGRDPVPHQPSPRPVLAASASEPALGVDPTPRQSPPEPDAGANASQVEPLEQHGELVPATDTSKLVDRSFVLTAAAGFAPVSLDGIYLSFGPDGGAGFGAGCNKFFGRASLRDGLLFFGGGGVTEMGCPDETARQETWLAGVMWARPRVLLDGDFWVRLVTDNTTLVFFEVERTAPPTRLIGTRWRITDLHGGRLDSIHSENDSALFFHEDGTLSIDTTCSTGAGRWAYRHDDRKLKLSTITYRDGLCGDSNSLLDAHVRKVIRDGSVDVTIGPVRLLLKRGRWGLTAINRAEWR